jgi:two-component system chemotaxis response regulator CheB
VEATKLVAIGASAGGLHALCTLGSRLPADLGAALVVVQHRSRDSRLLAGLLQDCTSLRVCEVNDKEPILAGHLYLGPPDYHLLVEEGFLALSVDEPVRWSRPSIDVMFESAADAYGPAAVGVVLTGANADGARGLRRIADAGGKAVVQDPGSAEVRTMPAAAIEAVAEAVVLPLEEIAAHLTELVSGMPGSSGRRQTR